MLERSMITEPSSRNIVEEYSPYFDQYGFVQPHPEVPSLNGVRYTGEYVVALHKEGKLDEERQRLLALFESVQREPGLLMRTPDNKGGYESIDDTVSAITASHFLKGTFAKKFLEYGRFYPAITMDESDSDKEKIRRGKGVFALLKALGPVTWVYNNLNPEKFALSSWLGRFPQLIAHAQFAAGEPVPLWRQLWWAGAVIQSSFSKEQDHKVLGWHLIMVARKKSVLCSVVAMFWSHMFRKHYPEGIGQVIGNYFGDQNHPAAYWLRFEYGE